MLLAEGSTGSVAALPAVNAVPECIGLGIFVRYGLIICVCKICNIFKYVISETT